MNSRYQPLYGPFCRVTIMCEYFETATEAETATETGISSGSMSQSGL